MERPDDRIASVLRFAAELVAWVATPWALSTYSWLLAVLAVVVLIGLPTVFSTPGDAGRSPATGQLNPVVVRLGLGAFALFAAVGDLHEFDRLVSRAGEHQRG
ncbi:hypothetical protein GFH48_32330 [Streptomyces fagopyri]|uniref:Uncharacterized protein n=1 Tax=Streptomyces fagopyri TaxID=2662397 RepID=A0A5Q0LJX0_9ACTN|nr:hypothetical protein [Streptomyces fagopyri]QFZ77350.1 hypothetical protein GFH48_32330 [Streptomyces fagopyri]